MHFTIYADGLAEPNPGRATYAFVVYDCDGKMLAERHAYIGDNRTNNYAEYMGVGHALAWVRDHAKENPSCAYTVLSDSQLVVKQVSGEYACNKEELRRFRERCAALMDEIGRDVVELEWVKGDDNKADIYTRVAYKEEFGVMPPTRRKKFQSTPR